MSGGPIPSSLRLSIDTAADAQSEIHGIVEVVALESVDGSYTSNLVGDRRQLVVAHPDGMVAGLQLANVPSGTYSAIHLMWVAGSVVAIDSSGRSKPVRLSSSQLVIQLDRPTQLPAADGGWLQLRHRNAVSLSPNPDGSCDWVPDMIAVVDRVDQIRETRARILSTDVASLTAVADLTTYHGSAVTLAFADAVLLTWNGVMVAPPEFVAQLAPGAEILIDALFVGPGVLRVLVAWNVVDAPLPGRGNKSDVVGRIVQLDPAARQMKLRVLHVHKAGIGFPAQRPLMLTVVPDGKTKVKWLPRRGRHTGTLAFDSLRRGMLVAVEWHGAPINKVVTAHKVDIRADGWGRLHDIVDGRVDHITSNGDLVIGSDGSRPLVLRGKPYANVRAQVGPATTLVRRDGTILTPQQVRAGDRVRITVEQISGNQTRAALVQAY